MSTLRQENKSPYWALQWHCLDQHRIEQRWLRYGKAMRRNVARRQCAELLRKGNAEGRFDWHGNGKDTISSERLCGELICSAKAMQRVAPKVVAKEKKSIGLPSKGIAMRREEPQRFETQRYKEESI